MSRIWYRPLLRWQTGDEFGRPGHSARDPGKIGDPSSAGGILVRHAASFGTKSGILSGTRCVSGSAGWRRPGGGGFTRIPRRIWVFGRGRFGPRVGRSGGGTDPKDLRYCQTRSEFWGFSRDLFWDSLRAWRKIPGSSRTVPRDGLIRDPPVALAALPRRAPLGRAAARPWSRDRGSVAGFAGNQTSVWLERSRASACSLGGLAASSPSASSV